VRGSRLRERILRDHERLRALLDEVDRQAIQAAGESAEAADGLRALGLQLLSRFSEHLALEDRVLAPALRRAGVAGRERAEQLDADHREQRELLDYLLTKLRDPSRPAAVLATEWCSFVELLLDDMAHEELTILQHERRENHNPAKSPSLGSPGS